MLQNSQINCWPWQVAKASKVEKFRSAAKGLIAAVRVNAEFVLKHRQGLDYSPGQAASLATFLSSSEDKAKVSFKTVKGYQIC